MHTHLFDKKKKIQNNMLSLKFHFCEIIIIKRTDQTALEKPHTQQFYSYSFKRRINK